MDAIPLTIGAALAWGTEHLRTTSPTARLDAELLLGQALGWQRVRVLAEQRLTLSEAQSTAYIELIMRRAALEPVAYLIGRREFYGLEFLVDSHVLVPRPETELLVEQALTFAANRDREAAQRTIADIGTGSGCIAVTLAVHLPHAQIIATDISPDALAVAQFNAAHHGVSERIQFLLGDLLQPLPAAVDLLVSNPPYTLLADIDEGVRRYEPHLALDGGNLGLELYQRLLAQAPGYLRPGGAIFLEIGATQASAVTHIAQTTFPEAVITVHKDLAGLDRVVTVFS